MNKEQRVALRRLEMLAKVLDTADVEHERKGEPAYDQGMTFHPCGTPACAAGHYMSIPSVRKREGDEIELTRPFDSWTLWERIFGYDAKHRTAKQAAKAIRREVRELRRRFA